MENEAMISKDVKVKIPSHEAEVTSPISVMIFSGGGGLARQGSITKSSCLCSPTTHAGSFRCRLHRAPSLHRTKSINSKPCQDSQSKVAPTSDVLNQDNTVNAQ